jgi:predicted secreted Zn-dependent protease
VKLFPCRVLATLAVLASSFYASFVPSATPITQAEPLEDVTASNPPTVQTMVNYAYYDIDGATEADIRGQITALGPRDNFGTWGASTRWNVDWSYPYAVGPAGCSAGPVVVQLGVTVTLPRWNTPGQAPGRLVANWQRFSAAVLDHENGHRDIALQGASELAQALAALPTAATCADFERTARATGEAVVAQYNRQQIFYDQVTHHGATQGAVFP